MRTDPLGARPAVAALLAAALALAGGGAAAQTSPWYLSGQLSLNHDDNLFRLGEGQDTPQGRSRSDLLTSAALIGGLDQPIGRQRVQAALTLRDNRFDRNAGLDNQGYSGRVSLDWSTVNRLSGQLGASRSRELSALNIESLGVLSQRNLVDTEAADASVRVGLVTAFSMELSGGVRRSRNSLDEPSVQALNLDQDNSAFGLIWQPGSALDVALSARQARGRFPNFRVVDGAFEDDRFAQRGLELSSRWQASGASRLEARIGSGRTQYERDSERDFDSVNGSLSWAWRPTGKLTAYTVLSREKGQDNYPTSVRTLVFEGSFVLRDLPAVRSYLRTIDTVRWQVEWATSAKVGLSAALQFARRDAAERLRTVADGALRGSNQGIDETTVASLGARWEPTRWAQVGCDLRHESRRTPDTVTSNMKSTSLNCYAQGTIR